MPTKKQLFLRRMNTKAQDLLMPDEDLRLVINAEYDSDLGAVRKVKGYEQVGDQMSVIKATVIEKDVDWNQGTHTSTEAKDDTLQLLGGIITQSQHNDSHDVYGDNWIAQSFKATNTTLDKMAVFIDKVLGSTLSSYDNFNDNSFDTDLWTKGVGGSPPGNPDHIVEQNQRLELRTSAPSSVFVNADETDFDGIKFRFGALSNGGGSQDSSTHRASLTGNGLDIRIYLHITANNSIIRVDGVDKVTVGGHTQNWEFKPAGDDVEIYANGVLKYTVVNKNFGGAGSFNVHNAPPSDETIIFIDSVEKYESVTALSDLDVRVETDSSGPSGSLLSNGTATIDDADVGESVDLVEGDFSTNPTPVIETTYWLVLKQTGGDANNKYRVYKQNSNVYTDGKVMVSTDGGSSWDEDGEAPSDMAFTLYLGYATNGSWISGNQILASGQTLTQLVIRTKDLSTDERIDRIDITNTSDVSQSNYTTVINSGTEITLRASDFSSGFGFTNGNTFRVKLTMSSAGLLTPGVTSLSIDAPETEVGELSAFYQGQADTRNLMAAIAGTIKRLISGTWTDLKTNLTTGLKSGSTTFRASKKTAEVSDTASGGDLTTLEDSDLTAALNQYQGYFLKIVGGAGIGQMRVIQSHTGTTSSTTTSSSTSSTTSTTTTTTTTTTTSTSTTTTT